MKKVSGKDDLLNIETEENFFQVGKLSDSIIDEKDRLQSRNRIGLCHSDSIKLGLRIAEDCSIVTGKIWTVSGKNKCLHSWVEIPREGKESLCADYTINTVMQKSGYYRLHHIDENSVNSIHISEIRNDINELDNYTDKYTFLLKEYLVGKKDFAKKLYGFGGELSGQKIEENLYSSFDEMEK